MPSPNGVLSQEELEEVAKAINDLSADPSDPCPNCKKTPSEVIAQLGLTTFGLPLGFVGGGIPLVSTVCRQCGFFRQFAVMELGLSFRDKIDEILAPKATPDNG